MAMPLNMILVVCHTMYIVIWFEQTNILVYTCIYISLITMTNKSVMTFISVNKISVCLFVFEIWNLNLDTWSCVSLQRSTTLSDKNLLGYAKWTTFLDVINLPLSARGPSIDVRSWHLKTSKDPHWTNTNISNGSWNMFLNEAERAN